MSSETIPFLPNVRRKVPSSLKRKTNLSAKGINCQSSRKLDKTKVVIVECNTKSKALVGYIA